jgi:hypothetical protein
MHICAQKPAFLCSRPSGDARAGTNAPNERTMFYELAKSWPEVEVVKDSAFGARPLLNVRDFCTRSFKRRLSEQ